MDATVLIEAALPASDRPMRVEGLGIVPQGIFILLACCDGDALCPQCHHPSSRVASRYVRNVADLPWREMSVVLRLLVRRFFCDQADCPRKVFAEQFPQIARRHGRTTLAHEQLLAKLGLICGGQEGMRAAEAHGIQTSGDTVLRRIRRCVAVPQPTTPPRVVGIDDYAFRKGCRYGTVLIDHESGRPLDLLPDRSSESAAALLARYPQLQIVTRDRADIYANAITMAHPKALQIADRFHLFMNLDAAVVRFLERHRGEIARACEAVAAETNQTPATIEPPVAPQTVPQPKPMVAAAMKQRYEQAIALRKEGKSLRVIREQTKLNLRTIMKYLRLAGLPPRLEPKSRRCRRAARISPRRLSVLMLYDKVQPKPSEQKVIEHLRQQCPPIREGVDLARDCSTILKQRDSGKLLEWIGRVKQSATSKDLRNFAKSLGREWSSIKPAMDLHWSNARTEGHVNRIKMIKRSMYNRANFDLLRLRVLARGP